MPPLDIQALSYDERRKWDDLLNLAQAIKSWADDMTVRVSMGHADDAEDALERIREIVQDCPPLIRQLVAVAEAQERAAADQEEKAG